MRNIQNALSEYRGKSVVITGGASFIGSHLAELLITQGANVTVVDDLSSGKLENLQSIAGGYHFIHGNLFDPEVCRQATLKQQVLFHLAANHGGRGYIDTHPVECVGNMALDYGVFTSAAKAGVEKIVFASSACVYPTNLQSSESRRILLKEGDANFEEAGKAFADGEYGWAKLMGELQLQAIYKQYKIPSVACRIFTCYGERENESHAVIALIAKAIAKLDPFPIWGSGLQTRNFTYVKDTVLGLALSGLSQDGFYTINIGTSNHHTIMELLDIIFSVFDWRPKQIKTEFDKPSGVLSRASDNSLSKLKFDWEPSISLKHGVALTAKWYQENTGKKSSEELSRSLFER